MADLSNQLRVPEPSALFAEAGDLPSPSHAPGYSPLLTGTKTGDGSHRRPAIPIAYFKR